MTVVMNVFFTRGIRRCISQQEIGAGHFALTTVEEFKRKLESQNTMTYKEYALLYFPDIKLEYVCPKDLFGIDKKLIRVCADNNNVCDKKCWDAVMEPKVLKEVKNVFNND